MEGKKHTYNKRRAALWMIRAVLFFSVFTFSGYNELYSNSLETTTTELLYSGKSEVSQKVFTPVKATDQFAASEILSFSQSDCRITITNCNRRIETVFKTMTSNFLSYNWSLFPFKRITAFPASDSTDDLPILVTG
ncbi:MAG: hypothetical protein KDC34_10650 [Saprospiraceae bacterium]|nr:hypothetical protein [Saprospiraceae bacterium]